MRRRSKAVNVGRIKVGAEAPLSIQSMLNVPAHNISENIKQAKELEKNGCDIIRVSIPDIESVKLIEALKNNVSTPIVADIHFNYKLAIESAAAGADKIRINPGNIGSKEKIKAVADACRKHNIAIRTGVNSGSLEKSILEKYGRVTPEALCESALYNASLLEQFDFNNIIISVKSSNVYDTVHAFRLIADKCEYPLHIGVTEAGTERIGIIKSSAALGALLIDGIGDTIRISLTDNPLKEVQAAKNLLTALELNKEGITFISCPTCGRTGIDIIKIAKEAEARLSGYKKKLKVAVMGCVVNGPGEAGEADIGITGGNGVGIIFRKGKVIRRVEESKLVDSLIEEIDKI